jgi:hypothetical protein
MLTPIFTASAAKTAKVNEIIVSTNKSITALRDEGIAARKRFADASSFDEQLTKIGQEEEAKFNKTAYKAMLQTFDQYEQAAEGHIKDAMQLENATVAAKALNGAQSALDGMSKVSGELDLMEDGFQNNLHSALEAKLDPELAAVDSFSFSENASMLQAKAHTVMDPLYSLGDDAEDKADRLNDDTNDALSAVKSTLRPYRRGISNFAQQVESSTELKLFSGSPDRTSALRRVQRKMEKASLQEQRLSVTAVSSSVVGVTGSPMLFCSFAATAAGTALVTFCVLRRRVAQSDSEYQLLLG